MKTFLIKVYHAFSKGKLSFSAFLDDIARTLTGKEMIIGLHYLKGELFYSLTTGTATYAGFESQFYTHFNDFQIVPDTKQARQFDTNTTVIGELGLQHKRFFPFLINTEDNSDFVFNLFRTFENFDLMQDKVGFFIYLSPIKTESIRFYVKSSLQYFLFGWSLRLSFFKYLFNFKIQKNRRAEGRQYFKEKLQQNLFQVSCTLVVQSASKEAARGKLQSLFSTFQMFKNYPLNQFTLRIQDSLTDTINARIWGGKTAPMTSLEIASFFHFPQNPSNESSLLTVKAKKLTLPIGVPTFDYDVNKDQEVIAKGDTYEQTVVGVSDYRSIRVPVGMYDEDRLRHMYVVGKTGVGKSKFLLSLMISDIKKGKGIGLIDPHGDLVEELMTYIPATRYEDVIIFDPTDEHYPFCLNPLDVNEGESKQVLAKGFIDIFKKFFGANRNSKLEHVLRMIFLALLDKNDATLYDIIRALTDKDFRYDMIDQINDDVVRNFRTNEFAGRSQQFNTEAIMPILNKVGQLLSIDMLKNIFASSENKLDFRKVMDEKKILLVKLPKGKLQEEIMGFLGAMFVTKLYQTAMGRQSVSKEERTPFFLYVDEFQNFATETFNEILSEARKYGLGLAVAHQFIKQVPANISDALFGNVGTLVNFRISSEDAEYMKQHFAPFLSSYDLANLNMREMYCKLLVQGQVKDPFSLKTLFTPDVNIDKGAIGAIYDSSRSKYARTLSEAKKVVEEQRDVMEVIEEFAEPIL